MLCPLTNNSQIRGNYSTIIKDIDLDPTNPLKFTMNVKTVNWEEQFFFRIKYSAKNHSGTQMVF